MTNSTSCTTPDCDGVLAAGNRTGLCVRCYKREYNKRHYVPRPATPIEDRRNPVSYANAHYRVQKVRGKARTHDCARCGVTADEWSYTPGDQWEQTGVVTERRVQKGVPYETTFRLAWSPNPWAYEPLCITCHKTKDREVRNGQ